jgi:hypothetical protein
MNANSSIKIIAKELNLKNEIFYDNKFDFSKKFEGSVIDIISRRKLVQISQDLQELNNIQRPLSRVSSTNNISFTNYDSFLNYKISTDSYTKALLNDS